LRHTSQDVFGKTPFISKVLTGNLHAGAKWEGKLIFSGNKPRKASKNPLILEDNKPVSEPIDSRSLPGGQWQRIALERAFMRIKDAELLILDEPSSALDPLAEYHLFKAIMELRKDKTTIYIVHPSHNKLIQSHHFHTVMAATKILVRSIIVYGLMQVL
jgi:ABC-type phosphate transport system ATPase subunit